MSNRTIPDLEERLKHASEAKKSMLAKFKMALIETPAVIENETSAKPSSPREWSAPHSVRRRGYAKSATERSKPSLQRRQQPTPNAWRPSKRPETLPNKQNVRRYLRLNRKQPAMPVTPHGRQPRSNGGEATSLNFQPQREIRLDVAITWKDRP
jgi:hypothetical protein